MGLVENELNAEEDESILASIDESSTEDDSGGGSIRTKNSKDIRDGIQVHPYINKRDTRTQSEWKGSEFS